MYVEFCPVWWTTEKKIIKREINKLDSRSEFAFLFYFFQFDWSSVGLTTRNGEGVGQVLLFLIFLLLLGFELINGRRFGERNLVCVFCNGNRESVIIRHSGGTHAPKLMHNFSCCCCCYCCYYNNSLDWNDCCYLEAWILSRLQGRRFQCPSGSTPAERKWRA